MDPQRRTTLVHNVQQLDCFDTRTFVKIFVINNHHCEGSVLIITAHNWDKWGEEEKAATYMSTW